MYTHVVLFRVKDKKNIGMVADTLRSMEGKIPVMRGIEVGINDVDAERNFDIVLIVRLDSKEDLDVYQNSDYHVNVVIPVMKIHKESSVAGDFAE